MEEFQGWIPLSHRDEGLGQHCPLVRAIGSDWRPHVEVTIYWSHTDCSVSFDRGADGTLIYKKTLEMLGRNKGC